VPEDRARRIEVITVDASVGRIIVRLRRDWTLVADVGSAFEDERLTALRLWGLDRRDGSSHPIAEACALDRLATVPAWHVITVILALFEWWAGALAAGDHAN
jgi:hypothetical protein